MDLLSQYSFIDKNVEGEKNKKITVLMQSNSDLPVNQVSYVRLLFNYCK